MAYRRKHKYHYREEKRAQIVFNAEPLSLKGPDALDIANEKSMVTVLGEAKRLKENKAEAQEREYVLQDLNEICQEWVKNSARRLSESGELAAELVATSRVRLYAYGSYKLDVHSVGSDVDLLCVGPRFLTRDMFFDELGAMLASNACISNFYAVPGAYVPVMSFRYKSIEIDIVYAQLQIVVLGNDWDINNDANLRNLDTKSVLAVNGVRLAHQILALVPNKDVFRLSLRAIRYWAKQRAIYSNKLGYLGGVSWAILTARVCQLYPAANASQIVSNFFLFYHIWNFGTPLKAITLCNIVRHEDMPQINSQVWDPNDTYRTKYELMHIITPAFPAMNSTHNVTQSQFATLKREIARGFHTLSRANTRIDEQRWRELFSANTFFIDHANYIFIKACAPRANLTEWSGLIESKIRLFVQSIEQFADVKVTPFCKAIKLKLTRKQIEAHTDPAVLAELRAKKKEKLKRLKLKKLKLKRERIEQQRLHKLQLKLQRERSEKRRQMELSKAQAAANKSADTTPTTPSESTPNGTPRESSLDVADEVILVSNLSLPISDATPDASTSASASSSASPKHKKKKRSTSVSPCVSAVAAPNKYVYVAPGLQSKYASKKKRSGSSERDSATLKHAQLTAAAHNPNACAFLVGKNVISCCQSFTPAVLTDKAEKFGYECRAFVIGLRVLKRANKSEEQSQSAPAFNFSRSVQAFLHNLNHRYTDSHILIELVSVHKMAHFLFPQYGNRRPDKETIVAHQKLYEERSQVWKSKSCIATIVTKTPPKTKKAEEGKAAEATATATAKEAVEAEEEKDDALLHDSDEALPGMGIEKPPEADTKGSKAEEESSNSRKRKLEEKNGGDSENDAAEVEPSSKRRRVEVCPTSSTTMQTVIIEHPDVAAEKALEVAPVENNPYYSAIDWSRKVDTSPTFEYALKLYKRSKSETAWSSSAVSHDLTATATYVLHTCADKAWAGKLKKVLQADKYGWNGCKYAQQLDRQRMFDLAHDIAYNYIQHKQEKEKRRKRKY